MKTYLSLGIAVFSILSCKPRIESGSRTLSDTKETSSELKALTQICANSKNRMLGTTDSNTVVYALTEVKDAETSGSDTESVGYATFKDGTFQLSTTFATHLNFPTCIRSQSSLNLMGLAFALGCTDESPCGSEKILENCTPSDTGCPKSIAKLSAASTPFSVDSGSLALTGDTETKQLSCVPKTTGYLLQTGSNQTLGDEPLLEYQCKDILLRAEKSQRFCVPHKDAVVLHERNGDSYGVVRRDFGSMDACVSVADRGTISSIPKFVDAKAVAQIDLPKEAGEPNQMEGLALTSKSDFAYKSCEGGRDHWYHLTRMSSGRLCYRPDTLYSWGDWGKVQAYRALGFSSTPLTLRGYEKPLFATHAPISTFGYGSISMRIKLKPNLNYLFYGKNVRMAQTTNNGAIEYQYCSKLLSRRDYGNTIIVRWWDNGNYSGLDYIICSTDVIESWSYGTQEHVEEMNRQVTHINSLIQSNRNDHYFYYETYVKRNGVDNLYPDGLDGRRFTPQVFANYRQQNMALHPGEIIARNQRDRDNHFRSDWPEYFMD